MVGYKAPAVRQRDAMETMRKERLAEATASHSPSPAARAKGPTLKLPTTTSRVFKTYYHTGNFGKTPFEKERIWSCCLASDPHARGCQSKTLNPDAYVFDSI